MKLRDEALSMLRAISPNAVDIWYESMLPGAVEWLMKHDDRLRNESLEGDELLSLMWRGK